MDTHVSRTEEKQLKKIAKWKQSKNIPKGRRKVRWEEQATKDKNTWE